MLAGASRAFLGCWLYSSPRISTGQAFSQECVPFWRRTKPSTACPFPAAFAAAVGDGLHHNHPTSSPGAERLYLTSYSGIHLLLLPVVGQGLQAVPKVGKHSVDAIRRFPALSESQTEPLRLCCPARYLNPLSQRQYPPLKHYL